MTDETKKSAYSTILLSTTGEDLSQVLSMTNEELENIKGNVNIVSEEDIQGINEFKDSLAVLVDNVAKPLMGVFSDIMEMLAPFITVIGEYLGIVLRNFEALHEAVGKIMQPIHDVFSEILGFFVDISKGIQDVFLSAEEDVGDSLENIKSDTEETFEYLNKAVENYTQNAMRAKEKQLRDRYSSGSLRDEEREIKRRQELYLNSKKKLSTNSNNYPEYAYAVGTKYHPGGMALVGENGPEVVYLPGGTQVMTNAHSQQILNQNQATGNTTYQLHNVTINSNNANDIFEQIHKENSKGTLKNRNIRVYDEQYKEFAAFCKDVGIIQAEALSGAIEMFTNKYRD